MFTLTVAANEVVVQDASLSEMSLVDSTGTRTAHLQSKVETTSIPATTEYLADDILEYGKTEVLTPAIKDATEIATTFKEIETFDDIVEQSAKDTKASTNNKYLHKMRELN